MQRYILNNNIYEFSDETSTLIDDYFKSPEAILNIKKYGFPPPIIKDRIIADVARTQPEKLDALLRSLETLNDLGEIVYNAFIGKEEANS